MKRSLVILSLLTLCLTACGKNNQQENKVVPVFQEQTDLDVSSIIEESDQLSNVTDVEETATEVIDEVKGVTNEIKVKKLVKLSDLDINAVTSGNVVYNAIDKCAGIFNKYAELHKQTDIVSDSGDSIIVEDEVESSDYGYEVVKSMGVHVPYIDDWFDYTKSEPKKSGNSWVVVETSNSDKEDTVTITISNKELEVTQDYKDKSKSKEIANTSVITYDDGSSGYTETVWRFEDIWYKVTTSKAPDEFAEIIAFIINATRQ